MHQKPLISVIMIFLNTEEFIQEAIESVIAQTYTNWELILVDDGSTDGSSKIAKRYTERYPDRIHYHEHDQHANLGMSASRNLGMQRARGEYIGFLDADDVYLPEKLERQAAILAAHPDVAMVYGATQHWFSWSGNPEDRGRDYLRTLGVPTNTVIQPPALVPKFLRLEAQTPGTCGILLRHAMIDQVGGFEVGFRGMFEDQVMIYKICLKYPVFVESGSWDRYRQHRKSHHQMMLRKREYDPFWRPNRSLYLFLSWLESYLNQQNIRDSDIWKALKQATWPYRHPMLYRAIRLLRQGPSLRRAISGSRFR